MQRPISLVTGASQTWSLILAMLVGCAVLGASSIAQSQGVGLTGWSGSGLKRCREILRRCSRPRRRAETGLRTTG